MPPRPVNPSPSASQPRIAPPTRLVALSPDAVDGPPAPERRQQNRRGTAQRRLGRALPAAPRVPRVGPATAATAPGDGARHARTPRRQSDLRARRPRGDRDRPPSPRSTAAPTPATRHQPALRRLNVTPAALGAVTPVSVPTASDGPGPLPAYPPTSVRVRARTGRTNERPAAVAPEPPNRCTAHRVLLRIRRPVHIRTRPATPKRAPRRCQQPPLQKHRTQTTNKRASGSPPIKLPHLHY